MRAFFGTAQVNDQDEMSVRIPGDRIAPLAACSSAVPLDHFQQAGLSLGPVFTLRVMVIAELRQ